MKKSIHCIILLVSFLCLGSALANPYVQYEPIPTTEYLEKRGVLEGDKKPINIRLGFEGIYGKAGENSFTYAGQGLPTATHFASVKPKDTFNFRIVGAYEINDTTEISINWLHLQSDTSQSTVSDDFDLRLPQNPTHGFGLVFDRIDGSIKTRLDAINVEMARIWRAPCLPDPLTIRTFAGMQYLSLKIETHAAGTDELQDTPSSLSTESRYSAIGPRAGTEISYNVFNELALVGSVAGNLLFGNSRWKQTAIPIDSSLFTTQERQSQTVFGLETKTGLSYTLNINLSKLSLEGGYQWASYFNSVRNTNFAKEDFTYHGPYFAVRLAT